MALKITRRGGIIAGIIGAVVLAGGIAFAALLLNTSISGQTSFKDANVASSVVNVKGSGGIAEKAANSPIDCSSAVATADGITVNPVIPRLVGGGTTEITKGSCTVTGAVKNTGDVAIYFSKIGFDQLPAGITAKADYPAGAITPGATSDKFTITLTVGDGGSAGGIAGRLVMSTDAGPAAG